MVAVLFVGIDGITFHVGAFRSALEKHAKDLFGFALFSISAESFSRLCVQPASIPASICGALAAMPTALACRVSLVLPSCSAKLTVVVASRSGLSCESRATEVKTIRSDGTIALKTPVIGYSTPSGARMTMRRAPPGRASVSHTGLVKPWGPHQIANCLGSGHA